MKKRNIKNEKIFEKYVLKPLSDLLPVEDIKIYYADNIIQLLEITRKEDKSLILDYANKSFEGVKKLKQIKIEQAEILKEFFENDSLKSENEVIEIIKNKNLDFEKTQQIFLKYDNENNGFISFNDMKKRINEVMGTNIFFMLSNRKTAIAKAINSF